MMLLIGFFLPALIGVVNRFVSDKDARFWISAFIAGLFGIGLNLIEHNGTFGYTGMSWLEIANSFAENIMAMIGMVKISYEGIWNNEAVGKALSFGDQSPLERMDLKSQ